MITTRVSFTDRILAREMISWGQRTRSYTEEKAKVVAASWGTEFLKFLAAAAILHQDDLKNRLICTRTSSLSGYAGG